MRTGATRSIAFPPLERPDFRAPRKPAAPRAADATDDSNELSEKIGQLKRQASSPDSDRAAVAGSTVDGSAVEGALGELAALFLFLDSSTDPRVLALRGVIVQRMAAIVDDPDTVRRLTAEEFITARGNGQWLGEPEPVETPDRLDLYFRMQTEWHHVQTLSRAALAVRGIDDGGDVFAQALRRLAQVAEDLAHAGRQKSKPKAAAAGAT